MDKWADYLISEVSYDSEHLLSAATRHNDTAKGIDNGKLIDRLTIASDIKNGLIYITIYNGSNTWKKGHKINTFSLSGNPYLRIDKNKVPLDFLGDLPEISIDNVGSDKIKRIKSEPVTDHEPPSPRGSLPKESSAELLQELESQPEPVTDDDEEATPEQLARLEQLEQQIQELESQPEPVTDDDEEATPEQLTQLDDLQKQIRELENTLYSQTFDKLESQDLMSTEQLTQLDDLQKQIRELENALSLTSNNSMTDGFTKIQELESKLMKLESPKIEFEIIEKLNEQNKKLDDLEKKLDDSTKN